MADVREEKTEINKVKRIFNEFAVFASKIKVKHR